MVKYKHLYLNGGEAMKNTGIKKFAACTVVIALLGTCGAISICKEKSAKFAENMARYKNEFVDDDFFVAAHRGFSSIEVENTAPAFIAAQEANFVDFIELDVRLTRDNKLVCVHNDTVVDSQLKKHPIADMYYSEFNNNLIYREGNFKLLTNSLFSPTDGNVVRERMFHLYGQTYSIIELADALKACGEKKVFIDLKFNDDFESLVEVLADTLQDVEPSLFILQSSDLMALKKLQELYPNFNYLAIVNDEKDFIDCDSFQMLGVRKNLVDTPFVATALKNGKQLSVWTVNTTQEVEAITKSLGEAYDDVVYISDYPDVISYHLNTVKLEKKKVTTQ